MAAEPDGVVETPELNYVAGLDWYGISETLFSFQIFQSWQVDDAPGMLRDDLETTFTFLARREFMNDRLVVEVIWLHGLNHADGLLRPKATYELSDSLLLQISLELFYGTRHGLFGEFDHNDRVFVSLQWSI